MPAFKTTLADLQLDYLDLYLMHWPIAFAPHLGLELPNVDVAEDFLSLAEAPLLDTWEAMEELVKLGLVRYLGVSNFSVKKLSEFLPGVNIYPAVNQFELHPFLAEFKLVDYCQNHDIVVTASSPFGSPGRPELLKKPDNPNALTNTTILSIAKQHHATAAQIILAWHLQRNIVVVPKSAKGARIAENFAALEITLSDEEMQRINQLDNGYRYFHGQFISGKGSPYTPANIFDSE